MKRMTGSASRAPRVALPADRGPSRRGPIAPWLEWGMVVAPATWWESVADPCPPSSRRPTPAEAGRCSVLNLRESNPVKGGAHVMARIFSILTALASLFLVAGASTKY